MKIREIDSYNEVYLEIKLRVKKFVKMMRYIIGTNKLKMILR